MIDVYATIISIMGSYFNARRLKIGQHISKYGFILWISYGIKTSQISIIVTFTVFLIGTLYSIYHWKKLDRKGDNVIK